MLVKCEELQAQNSEDIQVSRDNLAYRQWYCKLE